MNAYLRLIDALDVEIGLADGWIAARVTGHGVSGDPGHPRGRPGLGGGVRRRDRRRVRFASARHLCSWAGLTPRHRESDTTVHRGPITKQGSTLIRWAAVEAVQRIPATAGWLVAPRAQISARRGRNIATVAVARRLLTLVYYGLRDGHIRALRSPDSNSEPQQRHDLRQIGRVVVRVWLPTAGGEPRIDRPARSGRAHHAPTGHVTRVAGRWTTDSRPRPAAIPRSNRGEYATDPSDPVHPFVPARPAWRARRRPQGRSSSASPAGAPP